MAAILLLVFVVGLALLPIMYLERSRRRWQYAIRERGAAATATIVSVVAVLDPRGFPTGWCELTFEFTTEAHGSTRTSVYVKSAVARRAALTPGTPIAIHHMPHVPTEAAPDAVDCRPAWVNVSG